MAYVRDRLYQVLINKAEYLVYTDDNIIKGGEDIYKGIGKAKIVA